MKPSFELVSFDLCPYVQRSVITLKRKGMDFKTTFIDLQDPPEWFEKISPLGKVPLLIVRDGNGGNPTVLFESAVINEYLDEISPPSLHPKDPLAKARERAWIEVSSELMGYLYEMSIAPSREQAIEAVGEMWETLARVEDAIPGGATFRGGEFSLVDAAFAPFFMRLQLFRHSREDAHWKALPKVARWSAALLAMPEVRESVIPEFKLRYADLLKKRGSWLHAELS